MIVCTLRNDKNEYISMSGGVTENWYEASKFREIDICERLQYVNEDFNIVKFKIKELNETDFIFTLREVGKMIFEWSEVVRIMNEVDSNLVFICTTNLKSKGNNLISQYSLNYSKHIDVTDIKYDNFRDKLYKFESMYSSWNDTKFYNYVISNDIKYIN